MRFFRFRNAVLPVLAALGLGLAPHAAAQTYAALHGTVTDASGAVVPRAAVTALDTSTGVSTASETNDHGYFIFPQLHIGGPYTVSIVVAGFETFRSAGLILNLNDNREVNAQLKVGAATQSVEVQASALQVETSDTQLKQVMTAETIESMPLLNRDASGLQKLAPGSVESSDRFGSYSANGSQTQSNSYLLDGIDLNDGPIEREGIAVNPDALAELNVVTSTLNPEFARNGGAIVNETLKSGTNTIHGSGFWNYRDTFLNNGNYFSASRPPFHQNVYGGTLGGPVLRDKLFLFLAYQGFRNRTGGTVNAPDFTPDQAAGNFSFDNNLKTDLANNAPPTAKNPTPGLTSNPIPFAINGCPAGTPWAACFPGGTVQIAQGSYNPIALALLKKYVPPENYLIVNPKSGAKSYFYNFNTADTGAQDQGVIRADYHLSGKDTIWASSIFESAPDAQTLSFGGSDFPGFGMIDAEHFKLFAASWTHTFNASTLNEFRAGYFRFNFGDVDPVNVVQPSSLGFDITPQSSSAGVPNISLTGLNPNGSNYHFLGFSYEGPQPRKDTNLTGADNFTKIVGNHSLKFGVSAEQFIVSNPYNANNSGVFSYSGGGIYSSGDPILDFVMGIPDGYDQTSGSFIDSRGYEYYTYAQDSWKATHDLTLNGGVSWDIETPYSNGQFNGLGVVCWAPNSTTSTVFPGGPPGLTYNGDPGCNTAGGPTPKYDHFGPRVGFAWSPSLGPSALIGANGAHNLSIRGGFGIYYNRDAQEGQLQNLDDPPGLKNSLGVQDLGGSYSPAFANPFSDVAGKGSEPNPFPYVWPKAGSKLDWPAYAEMELSTYPKNYSTPSIYNFNLNIQRSLGFNMIAQIGYVGSVGRHLVRAYEGDTITPAGHAACLADPVCSKDGARIHIDYPQYTLQPALAAPGVPWYLSVGQQGTNGISGYNSLQASLTKSPSHGLFFTLAYTYSHGLDNASGLASSGFNGLGANFTPGYQHLSYGDSDYDARHRLAASYNYEIPILHAWHENFLAREAIGGWHMAGVTALQTGFPVTITDEGAFSSLWCDEFGYYYCPDTPNTSTFHIPTQNPRTNGLWFDGSVFSPEATGTFGNVKRNFFHGPGFNYTNLQLYKNFPLGSEASRFVQIQLQAFNAFNHANFAAPDGNFTDGPFFGTVSAVQTSADVNGDPVPGRAVQIAAKFNF
jgi:hypothetical protein